MWKTKQQKREKKTIFGCSAAIGKVLPDQVSQRKSELLCVSASNHIFCKRLANKQKKKQAHIVTISLHKFTLLLCLHSYSFFTILGYPFACLYFGIIFFLFVCEMKSAHFAYVFGNRHFATAKNPFNNQTISLLSKKKCFNKQIYVNQFNMRIDKEFELTTRNFKRQ